MVWSAMSYFSDSPKPWSTAVQAPRAANATAATPSFVIPAKAGTQLDPRMRGDGEKSSENMAIILLESAGLVLGAAAASSRSGRRCRRRLKRAVADHRSATHPLVGAAEQEQV